VCVLNNGATHPHGGSVGKAQRKTTTKRRNKSRNKVNFKARTPNQLIYYDSILANKLTLCSGPAGSSKTFTACAAALQIYLTDENIKQILIVRPAVEACGESLGFLPGNLDDKLAPFMNPVLDNLSLLVKDKGYLNTLIDTKTIQMSALGHIRGRSFHDCLVIFDEAQNATVEQMKLFLTRIGQNCRVIVEGDITQSDIPGGRLEYNGLYDAIKRLRKCDNVAIVQMTEDDIVRSKLVKDILKAYG
jgi:phosphate starvation-inducible PhoH-like protein